jgi:hypothetical protein
VPRTCTICAHRERSSIDETLVRREPYRDISRRFSVSRPALGRHLNEHLVPLISRVRDEEGQAIALDVVQQLRLINATSLSVLEEARDGGDPATALRAIDRIQRQIELQAKLLGNIDERPAVNLYISTEWLELRALIVSALKPHPDARSSVLRALEGAASGNA